MRIYLTEKAEVAEHLAKVLNINATKKIGYWECTNDSLVTWAAGHLLEVKEPGQYNPDYDTWKLSDLPLTWPVEFQVKTNTAKQYAVVSKLLKKSTHIYSCTDPDSAGQMIADSLFEYLKIPQTKITRVLIDDNNPTRILKAISNARPNFEYNHLYQSELARTVADQRMGINLTRLIMLSAQTKGVRDKLLVGRVKSAMLSLVVNRERERANHKTRYYYNIESDVLTPIGALKVKLDTSSLPPNFLLDEKGRLSSLEQSNELIKLLRGRYSQLTDIKTKKASDSPPLPFDLLALQSECSRKYGMKPDKVMEITQSLRMAPYYAITYNRSDCRYIPEESYPESPMILTNLANVPELSNVIKYTDPKIKSRAFNSTKITAHGAIVPTGCIDGYDSMNADMKRVYLLIVRNYIIQFLPKREREIIEYDFSMKDALENSYRFYGRSQKIINFGWSAIFEKDQQADGVKADDEEDTSDLQFSLLVIGQNYSTDLNCSSQTSKPHSSYTMTSLLNDLKSTAKYIEDEKIRAWLLEKDKDNDELGGIGTAATRSGILKDMFDSKLFLLQKEKKNEIIIPSDSGYLLYDVLPPEVRSPALTAIWSNWFKQMSQNEANIHDFWNYVDSFISNIVRDIKFNGLKIPDELLKSIPNNVDRANNNSIQERITADCPKCHELGAAILSKGRYGHYWKCTKCSSTFDDLSSNPFYELCPECNQILRVKKGKSKFIGCSNYPKCNYKRSF